MPRLLSHHPRGLGVRNPMQELAAIIAKSLWVSLTKGTRDFVMGPTLLAQNPGKHMLMGDDRRL